MIQPGTGTPRAVPTLMMVAALWTWSVFQVVLAVRTLGGVFRDAPTLGGAPPVPLQVVESPPPKKNPTALRHSIAVARMSVAAMAIAAFPRHRPGWYRRG